MLTFFQQKQNNPQNNKTPETTTKKYIIGAIWPILCRCALNSTKLKRQTSKLEVYSHVNVAIGTG